MIVGIPTEQDPSEKRVAATPRTVVRLCKMGFDVLVEKGAGNKAEHQDQQYIEAGAQLVDDAAALWSRADIVLKVNAPTKREVELMKSGTALIGFLWPAQNPELLQALAKKKIMAFSMDAVPRISRAQKMDALSAMANLAGYRSVIEAANAYPRLMSGQITAAGKVRPAKVLVIGGGVAGLAAIGAARGLGAIVRAFDTRPAVKEQVESMGAEFLELDFEEDGAGEGGYAKEMSAAFIEAEMALFAQQAMEVDIIITTALIPGKPAPKLITAGMVKSMREGSVIVDLAAPQGGNCSLTKPGATITEHGVRIVGATDLVSRMALQSSWLYSSTVVNLLESMLDDDGKFAPSLDDEVVRGALVTNEGEITWPPPKLDIPQDATAKAKEGSGVHSRGTVTVQKEPGPARGIVLALVALAAAVAIAQFAPQSFLSHFTVFVLAIFVGWQVIWNVTPALHTPLMSVTNAISGIIIIGGILQLSGDSTSTTILGAIAVCIAMINIAGGFLVTKRMLGMFSK
ncbi:MAG: Re/Si-specific NAD(P)(+) transhydrogenase subunit alpha [Planctomycetes bacterium]|nr:Re/Si-specific NAD(P)(+) transhydrogenase subunit alpha [Planctomycetota bacterium]